jgi:hypothetical protein
MADLFLKIDNVEFRDKGMYKDNSRLIHLITPELTADDSGTISEFHKQGEVSVIIVSKDLGENFTEMIIELIKELDEVKELEQ